MTANRSRYQDLIPIALMLLLSMAVGCGSDSTGPPDAPLGPPDDASVPPDYDLEPSSVEPETEPASAVEATPATESTEDVISQQTTTPPATASVTPSTESNSDSLDAQLAALEIPPAWLASVSTSYDTLKPWKDARLEIRRLFSLGKPESHHEGIKLTWLYLQKNDIGDGHEYAMYTFLGGEPLWSIRAHEEFLAQPHENTPIHAYITLAALYRKYDEFERAKKCLDTAVEGLPDPPWKIMQQANLMAAYGDLYADWGDVEQAKQYYAQSIALYPTAKPPYGRHLLPSRAADVQAKLDLLTFRSLQTVSLKDGTYRDKALGYVGDIHVTVKIDGGQIAKIDVKHEEKIDQNACVLIPERIREQQSLEVDGVSGATVTTDAIITAVYRCLQQAGLE